jgi:hypothetical protein
MLRSGSCFTKIYIFFLLISLLFLDKKQPRSLKQSLALIQKKNIPFFWPQTLSRLLLAPSALQMADKYRG